MEIKNVNKKNKNGFTVVELLVSLAIFSIVWLGLLATTINVYNKSIETEMRNEAIYLASEFAEKYRNMNITEIPATAQPEQVKRLVRNKLINYTINVTSKDVLSGYAKKVVIEVSWKNKDKTYNIKIETIVGKK